MKKIILAVVSALISLTMSAQTNNFSVTDNGKLIWQKVFDTTMSADDIYTTLINDGRFVDIQNNGGAITCRIPNTTIDVTEYGYSRGSVAMYVVLYDLTGFATIQVKDGRYRVTVEDFTMVCNTNGTSRIGDRTPLDTWAVRGSALSKGFSKAPSAIYDAFLTEKFTLKPKSYINDEW